MKRIILSGCNGKMGRTIVDLIKDKEGCKLVAGIDFNDLQSDLFPVFRFPADCDVKADVIIDFSHPAGLSSLLDYAIDKKLPLVLATTGLSEEQLGAVHEASKEIPIFHTANMSLGVNLMVALVQKAALVLGDNFDIEIIEKRCV